MAFFQDPPAPQDGWSSDRVLQGLVRRRFAPDRRAAVEASLEALAQAVAGPIAEAAARGRAAEPRLVPFDPWGRRVDTIEVTPAWALFQRAAAEHGVVATAYEGASGAASRIHQFALAYLFERSTHTFNCPLAMTDGAARTLLAHGHQALIARAVPRLTSRDPARMWTSGQWMTERTGGSDVGLSETRAVADGEAFRLYGTKWFTSATTSEMALTLARPEGAAPGGAGLTLFYVEHRLPDGASNGIRVLRLKDKLGTRMLPTAELELEGAVAIPVAGIGDGVRNIAPMLNVTRTWNAVSACGGMRHGLALARDYAERRVAFGAPLAQQPLHRDTLAGLQAEFEAGFHLAFEAVRLLGLVEHGDATEAEQQTLRLLTPLAKLVTGKQAVAVASEILEAFGGAGYVEDTGLPQLLRDAQVLPIWEGTTNVLSLDTLRAIAREQALPPLLARLSDAAGSARAEGLAAPAEAALAGGRAAAAWLQEATRRGRPTTERGARRFALTLGRSLALALLVEHAQWSLDAGDPRPSAAARRFAAHGVDLLAKAPADMAEDALILG